MSDLADKKCVACEGNIPAFNYEEIHKYLKKVDGWDVKSNNGKSFYLLKEFKFKDFKESQLFVNKVGALQKKRTTILIYFLVGVTVKLRFSPMRLTG